MRNARADDHDLVGGFLAHVRNGVGATQAESQIIREVIAEHDGAVPGGADGTVERAEASA